ncbi:MAG: sigma 54-interacting transcriptional regulator, partial [Bacteroidales bacterium]|nr:sigma 54-interacting transcriptional regulator [Bacteroidales bacterium]
RVGANSIGTSIVTDTPLQFSGDDHYLKSYKKWTCSTAPIHDSLKNIIGTFTLAGHCDSIHSHTLGIAIAGAKYLEDRFESRKIHTELDEAYQYVNTIINTFSFGVFALDLDGKILRANTTAGKFLKQPYEELVGKSIGDFIPDYKTILKVVRAYTFIHDEEVEFKVGAGKERFIINSHPLYNAQDKLTGILLSFREFKRIMNLVHKYSGMRARYHFKDIINKSPQMKRIVQYAQTVASSPSTILIQGESGTGKEVIAQSIHNASDRASHAFVPINCGAIPENLIESELFGYDDGAFTGAKKGGHPGKFEVANAGTLFLDEVGEMPMDMQVKLLRALQEAEVTRVGGTKTIPVDVRIIAATNRNLRKLVDEGKFRLDLYYRLSVIPIEIPPLRDRRSDIPSLLKFFLNRKALKLNKDIPVIRQSLYDDIMAHDWPGNIRELENFVEKIVNFNGDVQLDLSAFSNFSTSTATVDDGLKISDDKLIPLTLKEMEKRAIIDSIRINNRNMSKVAKTLGISRNTLYEKMKRYDISYK